MISGESRWFLSKYLLWRNLGSVVLLLSTFVNFDLVTGNATPLRSSVLLGHSVQLACYPTSGISFDKNGSTASEGNVGAPPVDSDFYIVQWKKQGSPSPVLLWRPTQASREGRTFEGRVSLLARAALQIVDVRATDAGLYECQTWDVSGQPLGNGTATEVRVIDVIPKFVSQPETTLAAVSSQVQFNCTTDPAPDQVRWLRNGVPLTSDTAAVVLADRLLITISREASIRQMQQGTYQCVAVWSKAALRSVSANLTIAAISSFKELDTVRVTCQEGGNVVLVGSMPESLPPATPIVTHNGTILESRTARTILMASGNLHIQNVSSSDGGWYQFSAINSVTGERVTARNSILLEVVAKVKVYSPQLLAAPKQTTVAVGGNATLECAANSNPSPTIIWSKYGGVLPEGAQQILGNLQLYNLKLNDTGTYVCNASNGDRFPVSTIAALDVIVVPEIQKWTTEYEVREREDVSLDCLTKGYVKSYIRWLFNGTVINGSSANYVQTDSKLQVKTAQREQAGFYQCFAENAAGLASATARLRVVPRSAASSEEVAAAAAIGGKRRDPISHLPDKGWERKRTGTFSLSDDEADPVDRAEEEWQHKQQRKKQQRRKKKKNQNNDENGDSKVVMIPPTRPDVTKLSDESVMVHWSVPENAGLPILFFKVQYRDVDKPNSPILTIDEDIAPHILSYEVPNLKTGRTYRFRIAAVYSNNDNKLGPNSHKFTLHKDPPMKKPVVGPTIIHAEAISPSAIMIQWKYLDIEEVVIEGFFIYYRTTSSAGSYTKVTVLGANTPSHIISHLLPGTAYDIKMQCFNNAGTSDFSNIRTEKTNASAQMLDSDEKGDEIRGQRPVPPISDTAASDQLLYTILGTVLGSLTLLFIIFVSYCSWKQKRRRRLATLNSTAHSKENGGSRDASGKYAAVNGTPMGNGHAGNLNGVLLWNKPFPVQSGNDHHDGVEIAETTLSSPNVLINNNSVQGRRHAQSLVQRDAEEGSDGSDQDEADEEATSHISSSSPRPTASAAACRPLIHRERLSDDDNDDDYGSGDDRASGREEVS